MKKEVIAQLATLITASIGFVAALAWNTAIQSLFNEGGALYLLAKGGPWVYAILVTILAVIATMWLGRISARAEAKAEAKSEAKIIAKSKK